MNGNLGCKLFVGNLNYKTTEEDLQKFYEKFGVVENCYISRDKQTKKSKGYGFVTFIKSTSVDDAMTQRPHEIDERKLEPHRAAPKEYSVKPESHHTCNEIFVGNLKDSIDEEDLKEHFCQYGTIVKIDLAKDRKDPTKRKPFAFITFDDYDPVDICCHKKYHYVKKHKLDVTKSINKRDMAQLIRKFGNGRENGFGPNRQPGIGRGHGPMPYGYDCGTPEDEFLDRILMERAISRASVRLEGMNINEEPYRNDGWYDRSAFRKNNHVGGRYLAGGRGAPGAPSKPPGCWM